MANTVTSVLEIEEAGVLLRAEGSHVVKVLGAHQKVHEIRLPPMKEDLWPPRTLSGYERLYAGDIQAPTPDPRAPPDSPQVPQVYITAAGDPAFLERNVTA